MIQSDALSRRPDHIPDKDENDEKVIMLPEEVFINLLALETEEATIANIRRLVTTHDLTISYIDIKLQEEIAKTLEQDQYAKRIIELLKDPTGKGRKEIPDWTMDTVGNETALFYQERQYIPDNLLLRRHITRKYHDSPTIGHPGEIETFNKIRDLYWWPSQRKFIKDYCKGCATCQEYKINRKPNKPTLNPVKGSESQRPFANVSWDLITDLPETKDGYNAILSIVDHGLSKGVILAPTKKTATEGDIAQLLIDYLFRYYGLPDSILSDRDPRFTSKVFQEFLKLLGIEQKLSTAYHPQTDGSTERFNQEIEAYLAIFCRNNPETWKIQLAITQFTHNDRRHADRPYTPFELIMGISPIAIPATYKHSKYPEAEQRFKNLQKARAEAIAAHELGRQRMIQRTKNKSKPFKKGDKVWLDTRNLKIKNMNKKLASKHAGPFTILRVLSPLTYELKLPKHWNIHNKFHITLIKPYVETDAHGPNYTKPPPEIIDGEQEYEVEKIIRHKRKGQGTQFLIRWKGYDQTEDSWEPQQNLKNAAEILHEYKKRHHL